jgi:AAA+ superfamily predicted ATPase
MRPLGHAERTDRTERMHDDADARASEVELVLERVHAAIARRRAWLEAIARAGRPDADSPSDERAHDDGPGREAATALGRATERLERFGEGRIASVSQAFGLSPRERDLVELCFAHAIDPRVAAALASLPPPYGTSAVTEASAARLFGHGRGPVWNAAGPLARWELVREVEGAAGEPSTFVIDAHVRLVFQGVSAIDPVLAPLATLVEPRDPLDGWPVAFWADRLRRAIEGRAPFRLAVVGPSGSGRRTFAAAVAARLGASLLAIDTTAVTDAEWPRVFVRAQRQALLEGLALAWHGAHALRPMPPSVRAVPAQFVVASDAPSATLFDSFDAGGAGDFDVFVLPKPTLRARRTLWLRHVPSCRGWPPGELERIVERYDVTAGDIAALGRDGVTEAHEAASGCRARTRHRIGDLGTVLETPFSREDLVVPPRIGELLDDLLFEATERVKLFDERRDGRFSGRGAGLSALLSGPPGTGKTMTAQVVARELGLDLVRIDLASVVSKYIGETAKNLRRIFARADGMNAVLLFDEADALFARRTDVRDSHDRHANADTNYLLQLVEDFRGIALLASNQKQHIDAAFQRRLRYVLEFARPEPAERVALFRRAIEDLAGAEAVAVCTRALPHLAGAVELAGAQIRQSVLTALYASRRDGKPLALEHLVRGIDRELAKEGRSIAPAERERILARGGPHG